MRPLLFVLASASIALACSPKDSGSTASSEAGGESSEAGDGSTESSGGSSTTAGGTTDSTTTSGTTAGTSTTTDGGFVQVDQFGEAMCDIWNPSDCPAGEKCMPYNSMGDTWDALKCTEIDANPGVLGDECLAPEGPDGGVDNCGEGLFCYYVDGMTNIGTCIEFCTGSPTTPMCGPNAICTIVNDGVLVLCRPACDPITQDCQPAGSGCYQATGTGSFTCIADKSGDAGAYGDACTFISSCDPGLACVDGTAVPGCTDASCCTPFCQVGAANNCPGTGQQCEPYYDTPDPGYEDVGICVVPQPFVTDPDRAVDGPRYEASQAP